MIRPLPQQTLHTQRLALTPLTDEHLEWEVALDSDPEVMRYLTGRASTREEVEASHARRMAAARKVDGLGFWVGLVDDDFVGWWTLQPAHGPDQPDDPAVADLGYRLLQRHWRKGPRPRGRGNWCGTASTMSGSTESSLRRWPPTPARGPSWSGLVSATCGPSQPR